MKRYMLILAAGAALLMAALGTALAQDGNGEHAGDAEDAIRGAAVFAEFCQACHGPQGEAIGTGAAFGAIEVDPENAQETIKNEHQPPYGKLLTQAQIDELIAYLETWESGEVPPLPEPNIHDVPDSVDYFGDPHEGAVIYAKFCDGCHGPKGEGRQKPDFSPFEFSDKTARIVREEHVPAFGEAAGGPLSEAQITDLETYMASWQEGGAEGERKSEGINVLIVVAGALAIVAIGGAYLSRIITTEQA
jgi:mono/diheme cytochrome c family protein